MRDPYAAVLLDVDGTLIDSTELIARSLAWGCEAARVAVPPREDLVRLIGRPIDVQAEMLAGEERVATFIPAALEFYFAHPELEQPFASAVETLERMHASGVALALVTSKNRVALASIRRLLPYERLTRAQITADDVARPKPAPEGVLLALDRLGVDASRAIFIGDSPYDMQAGLDAGVATGAALWGPHPRQRLEPFTPTHWLHSLDEVSRLVLAGV
jgi:pyrophosphatase PpaX